MGFVLETHSRPWVQDLILHFVVAFKHCSSSFEGQEVPNLPLPGSPSPHGIKAPQEQWGGCLLSSFEPLEVPVNRDNPCPVCSPRTGES